MEYWVIAEKKDKIAVKDLTTIHIVRIMRCWEGKGRKVIPPNYLGGKTKWINILSLELSKRNAFFY